MMLGKYELNKIYNEDCYQAIKNIPDKSIDCIYTDIPYLYDNGGGGYSELSKRINSKKNFLSDISNGINYEILNEFIRVMKKVNIFIWCSKKQILDIMNFFKEYHCEILTWCKTNPQPSCNNVWLPDIEYCLYFRESGVKLNDGYNIKSKWYTSSINKSDKDSFEHPTIKPLEFVKRHILHATQVRGIILDPFMGSGTTAVACKETDRNFIGFEINEKYCNIANDRVNGITANGQTTIFTDFDNLNNKGEITQ